MQKQVVRDGVQAETRLAGDFYLFRAFKKQDSTDRLHIFIEGDGQAWLNRYQPSDNPTPSHAVGYQIVRQFKGNWAYLARPCQFVGEHQAQNCSAPIWTNARYAPEVINSTLIAIDQLKKTFGARSIYLYGYSGGGTLAALVAARCSDVANLVTVASPLGIADWVRYHGMSPLKYSHDPADEIERWSRIPQHHYAGAKDEIVPPVLYQRILKSGTSLSVIKSYDHDCCWDKLPIEKR
ncbi:hypothetical protein RYZ26_03425 [Terasakiella sp. A23]|uniref:alpha/beta hydrolase n=1 Tax=Terasakiella sp. FCG-A23 TaxID=3080561 RepID=UPI002955041A|nr:hypothetical protein [Terasakiella sp. A23]MDV7338633.1 hypothetical protein [Terasakiella sp. A23]